MIFKMDFGDRCMILHDGCENPTVYYFNENGAKVWVEVDPKDVGVCDEECSIFRAGEGRHCIPVGAPNGSFCTRVFKPQNYQTAQELGMVG